MANLFEVQLRFCFDFLNLFDVWWNTQRDRDWRVEKIGENVLFSPNSKEKYSIMTPTLILNSALSI